MHGHAYACISMHMHAYPWICMHGNPMGAQVVVLLSKMKGSALNCSFYEVKVGGRDNDLIRVFRGPGLLDILSLEDSVSLLVGPGFGLLTPLTFWASNSLASLPGLQDSRIASLLVGPGFGPL